MAWPHASSVIGGILLLFFSADARVSTPSVAPEEHSTLVSRSSLVGEACASGEQDSCHSELWLLQTDVQVVSQRASKPVARKQSRHLMPSTGRVHFARLGRINATNISVNLSQVNLTFATVQKVIDLVNGTVGEVLKSGLDMAGGFTVALGKIQAVAEALKTLFGPDAVAAIVSLVRKLDELFASVTARLQAYSDKEWAKLQAVAATFRAGKEKVYESLAKAQESVKALAHAESSSTSSTVLLQLRKSEGVPVPCWLKKLWGGCKRKSVYSPGSACDQASDAIQEANDTMVEVFAAIPGLQSTMCTDFDNAVIMASAIVAQAKVSFADIMAHASGFLPGTAAKSINDLAAKFFGAASQLQAKVDEHKVELADLIATAQLQAKSLYNATGSMANSTAASCANAASP
eukprot:CAMPEP_0170630846 /NCGR_PEP_ID=MMETSP0224-20130122/34257_1 /TAXON_ID=285029 /ORGANISM="Togula jolla, Strain CCCM 725" /LENGTH=404 /DNA_ID=CAMNT_0010959009 /DNA_START=55 /DNA_END=1269 /DNA_ORIENTATION=-